jgi:hypothetical protein
VWTFPEAVENHLETMIDYVFRDKDEGIVLHAPAGISKIGQRNRIDRHPGIQVLTFDHDLKTAPDIIGDLYSMRKTPEIKKIIKARGGFDLVISDPVWLKVDLCQRCKDQEFENEKGISYPMRRRLSYSVRDILKPGGLWFFNGLWNPEVKGLKLVPFPGHLHEVEMVKQKFNSFRNLSLIMCLKRVNEKIV